MTKEKVNFFEIFTLLGVYEMTFTDIFPSINLIYFIDKNEYTNRRVVLSVTYAIPEC